jgi:hypothetical protein
MQRLFRVWSVRLSLFGCSFGLWLGRTTCLPFHLNRGVLLHGGFRGISDLNFWEQIGLFLEGNPPIYFFNLDDYYLWPHADNLPHEISDWISDFSVSPKTK